MPTLLQQGYLARTEQRLPDAHRILTEAVADARKQQDRDLLAKSLTALGQIERDLGNHAAAQLHYEEAVAIYRTLNTPLKLAHTIRHVGDILRNQSQFPLAAPHYEEALGLYRAHPETQPLDLANALRGFALLKQDLSQPHQALLLWQEARGLYASLDIFAGVAEADTRIAQLTQT